MKLTIRDLAKLDGTWDVYGDTADEIGVAFVNNGTGFLTDQGKEYFKDILDTPIVVSNRYITILTSAVLTREEIDAYDFDDYDSYPPVVQAISDFFWGYAGYMDTDLYEKLFV